MTRCPWKRVSARPSWQIALDRHTRLRVKLSVSVSVAAICRLPRALRGALDRMPLPKERQMELPRSLCSPSPIFISSEPLPLSRRRCRVHSSEIGHRLRPSLVAPTVLAPCVSQLKTRQAWTDPTLFFQNASIYKNLTFVALLHDAASRLHIRLVLHAVFASVCGVRVPCAVRVSGWS